MHSSLTSDKRGLAEEEELFLEEGLEQE